MATRFDWTKVSGTGYIYDNEKQRSVPIEAAIEELHERMISCEVCIDRLVDDVLTLKEPRA